MHLTTLPSAPTTTVTRADLSQLCGNQNFRRVLLNRRVDLHAIDATPARWRGGVGLSPLDGASTAALSSRNDFVENYRVHPTHCLISTQAASVDGVKATEA